MRKRFQKAIVIGCPGSGKSVFSRKLRDATGLPLYYLDQLWHLPDRSHVSREEFDRKLALILSQDAWIIDGHYQRTLETRIKACDQIFCFDLTLDECLQGARARVGQVREEMPWLETAFDPEFGQYIRDFHRETRPECLRLLECHREKPIAIFRSHEEADFYLKTLSSEFSASGV